MLGPRRQPSKQEGSTMHASWCQSLSTVALLIRALSSLFVRLGRCPGCPGRPLQGGGGRFDSFSAHPAHAVRDRLARYREKRTSPPKTDGGSGWKVRAFSRYEVNRGSRSCWLCSAMPGTSA